LTLITEGLGLGFRVPVSHRAVARQRSMTIVNE
jgi:hypothetical protein